MSWQKAEGCPDLCVHFQKHLTLDQILSAVLKLGDGWEMLIGQADQGAQQRVLGAQPGASLQLAS